MSQPYVSINTPIYDRKKFLPLMIKNLEISVYPKDKLEWVILDSYGRDGDIAERLFENDAEVHTLEKQLGIRIKYIYRKEALSIGKKRNMLAKLSTYDILINMDSDDVYFHTYISYSVKTLIDNKLQCVGSPQMLFVYPNDNYKVTMISCGKMRLAHEATMCLRKKHLKRMGGYSNSSQGEGTGIIDGCDEKMFRDTDIRFCMICVCGDHNTISKDIFNKDGHLLEKTNIETLPQLEILKSIFIDK
jgi:glycosyltransferase involved in cell wall biosynthesis